ncbi:MAG: RNA methyltransferase [Acidobacteriota bacterium]
MPTIVKIASRDNEYLKEARRVRDGKQRDKIFIEGVRLIEEAVLSGVTIDRLFVSDSASERSGSLVNEGGTRETFQLTDAAFRSIADTVTSQGVVALAERPAGGRNAIEERLATSSMPLVAFLYETNNPSNLGAVIRTAEAAGAAGVIVSTGSADAFSPKALRAAMGSSFRSPVWTDVNLGEAIEWAADNDLQTIATTPTATTVHTDVDWTRRSMILFGSEAHGLPESELRSVDDQILISMDRSVESLNLAVACGVILFEARRQKGADQRSG